MSTRTFCDVCGLEIERNYATKRLGRELVLEGVAIKVEIIVATNGKWNEGDLCLNCLLTVINTGENLRWNNEVPK